jgi:hypothetical protein
LFGRKEAAEETIGGIDNCGKQSITIAFDGTDSLLACVDRLREVEEGVSQSPHAVGKPVEWKFSEPPHDFEILNSTSETGLI